MTTDHVAEFASLARNAIVDLADTTAAPDDAAEALAALEHQCGSLHGPHRYAADVVANALYRLHSKQPRNHECATEEAAKWLELACKWPNMDHGPCGHINAGKCLERASSVVDDMPAEHRELKQLLRCVIGACERAVLEGAVERQHGGRRAA